jgi:hypothetical protein
MLSLGKSRAGRAIAAALALALAIAPARAQAATQATDAPAVQGPSAQPLSMQPPSAQPPSAQPLSAQPPSAQPADAPHPAVALAAVYRREVDRRLDVPPAERAAYAAALLGALQAGAVRIDRGQFVLLVDRSAFVQAAMVWWVDPDGAAMLVGASPASTGRPSGFEHFETPIGVFEHSLANPDFRAEGTLNENGIRGYGDKGMRVYDFGWVVARRGWAPGEQEMRLQVHATDRTRLEPRLGQRASKGCVRIPAAMNALIDRHGVLDAAYDEALAAGRKLWVLRSDRVPSPAAGRWLVVVDSGRSARPAWSPAPRAPTREAAAAGGTARAC